MDKVSQAKKDIFALSTGQKVNGVKESLGIEM